MIDENLGTVALELIEREYILAEKYNFCDELDINEEQEEILLNAILCLPEKIQIILYAKYVFSLSSSDIDCLYNVSNSHGIVNYYLKLLSQSCGIENVISSNCMSNTLKIALEKDFNPIKKNNVIHIFNFAVKKISVAIIIFILILTSFTLINPEVRAVVFDFFVKTYDTFTDFRVIKDGTKEKAIADYSINYIPNGFEVVYHSQDDECLLESYENEFGESFTILLSVQNATTSVNTEGATLVELEINGNHAFKWVVDNRNYILFNDNNTFILICGAVTSDEILEIAKNIK